MAKEKETAVKPEKAKKPARVSLRARKAAKAEAKVPARPAVTEARAIAYDLRVTPRKARLVIDLVRGKDINEALGILDNVNRSASPLVAKVIKSAAANAINNFQMDEHKLYVHRIWAGDGVKMKRYLPRAKGSASPLIKRTSHVTVIVKER